jgi:hypothetical protein
MDNFVQLLNTVSSEELKDMNTLIEHKVEQLRLEIEEMRLANEQMKLANEKMQLENEQMKLANEKIATDLMKVNEPIEYNYEDILKYNLVGSTITSCEFVANKVKINIDEKELNYKRIARKIWESMPRQTLYDNSTFDMKVYYYNKHGYKWIYEIQLSVQIGPTSKILNEIVHLCSFMKYNLQLSIQLQNQDVLDIKVDDGKITHEVTPYANYKSNRLLYRAW